MRLYKRKDFIKLPSDTVYSRLPFGREVAGDLLRGLFCKCSGPEYAGGGDFVEQDLLAEHGFPNGIIDGYDAFEYVKGLRDSYQEFETDLHCAGRDGCFDDNDEFIVWDKKDVSKLINYLQDCLDESN